MKQLANTSREFAVYNLKEGKIKSLLSSNTGFNLVLKWKQRPNNGTTCSLTTCNYSYSLRACYKMSLLPQFCEKFPPPANAMCRTDGS